MARARPTACPMQATPAQSWQRVGAFGRGALLLVLVRLLEAQDLGQCGGEGVLEALGAELPSALLRRRRDGQPVALVHRQHLRQHEGVCDKGGCTALR
jgi:hypothetical protein